MILDVHVSGRAVAKLYRERDEYVLKYFPGTDAADFVSLTLPVREEAWRWPPYRPASTYFKPEQSSLRP